MNKQIASDIADWCEYMHKCESGNLGYPTNANFMQSTNTRNKCDPTPNHTLPAELVLIDNIMQEIDKNWKAAILLKFTRHEGDRFIDDEERARRLFVSIAKYYNLCREATAYIMGRYDEHNSDRRKKKIVNPG